MDDPIVQFVFGDVSERWVTKIVRQTCGFDDIRVEVRVTVVSLKALGQATPKLSDFEGVSEAVVKEPSLRRCDNLGHMRKSTKRV
jgi:hypothetical protein